MARILITGNLGYLGPVVLEHLRRVYPRSQLIGFDSAYFAHCLTTRRDLPERLLNLQFFGDVRELPLGLFADVDAVVHLAGISNDPMGNRFEAVTRDINLNSSVALARRAKDAGVRRLVFASSCSVYGAADGPARREDDALNPLTAYARSKIAAEQGLQPLAGPSFTVTCLRFATACGMSARLRLDLVLNDFVASARTSGEITVLSDGTPWRPLIAVEDMARAIEWAIEREASMDEHFLALNVGSNEWNYQVRDLAEAVIRELPGTGLSINRNAAPDRRSYKVDFSLFGRLAPRHQPQVDVGSAIRGIASGLSDIAFDDSQFRRSNLMRLVVLHDHIAAGRLDESLRWRTSERAATH